MAPWLAGCRETPCRPARVRGHPIRMMAPRSLQVTLSAKDPAPRASATLMEACALNDTDVDELGPVDYLVVEFPADKANFSGAMASKLSFGRLRRGSRA